MAASPFRNEIQTGIFPRGVVRLFIQDSEAFMRDKSDSIGTYTKYDLWEMAMTPKEVTHIGVCIANNIFDINNKANWIFLSKWVKLTEAFYQRLEFNDSQRQTMELYADFLLERIKRLCQMAPYNQDIYSVRPVLAYLNIWRSLIAWFKHQHFKPTGELHNGRVEDWEAFRATAFHFLIYPMAWKPVDL